MLTPSCDLLMPPLWRSMRGLMGRPALRSASPCRKIYKKMQQWHRLNGGFACPSACPKCLLPKFPLPKGPSPLSVGLRLAPPPSSELPHPFAVDGRIQGVTHTGHIPPLPADSPPPPASAPIYGEHAWGSPNGRDRHTSGSSASGYKGLHCCQVGYTVARVCTLPWAHFRLICALQQGC